MTDQSSARPSRRAHGTAIFVPILAAVALAAGGLLVLESGSEVRHIAAARKPDDGAPPSG